MRTRLARMGVNSRVTMLVSAIAAVTVLIALLGVDFGARPMTTPVPWWALAFGFAVAESLVIHFELRSETYSFSLAEVPLVVGFAYASPVSLLLAAATGNAIALLFVRRQRGIKLAFNSVNAAAGVTLGIAAFQATNVHGLSPVAVENWPALMLAATAFTVATSIGLVLVVAVADGAQQRSVVVGIVAFAVVASTTNTAIAVLGALAIEYEPWSVGPVAIVCIAMFGAYRTSERDRRNTERLALVSESTRAVTGATSANAGFATLLEQSCVGFRCRSGRLVLLPQNDRDEIVVVNYDQPGGVSTVVASDGLAAALSSYAASDRSAMLVRDDDTTSPARQALAAVGLTNGMVAVLRGENATVGILAVGRHVHDVHRLETADLRLFEVLATSAALAIERDLLESSVREMVEAEQNLIQAATTDALTGLANRSRFHAAVGDALIDGTPTFVLYLDLDDFKPVNDTHGHAAGDDLLRVVSERLLHVVRTNDVVARLGGDEFAVLAAGTQPDADALARRIVDALSAPIKIRAAVVTIGCSVGAATAMPSDTVEELLDHADAAMYAAKSAGKGRFQAYATTDVDTTAIG